ncbi:MAG: hypothetical protein HUU55_17790 [Myxococcales bacterium]|nr:hypothetical protein [Myxococcales bacterium]
MTMTPHHPTRRAPGLVATTMLGCFVALVLLGSGCANKSSNSTNSSSGTGSAAEKLGKLTATLVGSAADVATIRFEVWQSGLLIADQTVPLETEPLHPELAVGTNKGQRFADAFFTLPEGDYVARAIPLQESGEPSALCTTAEQTVTVTEGETNEVALNMTCEGDASGGLDLIGVLNPGPSIVDLKLDPSKFIEACQKVSITVTATDSADSAFTYDWTVVAAPAGAIYVLNATGAIAHFAAETGGEYTVQVTAKNSAGQKTSLTFPIHVTKGTTTGCLGTDSDGDGIVDVVDNCVSTPNTDQTDGDSDGFGDVCDPCPSIYNGGDLKIDGGVVAGATTGRSSASKGYCADGEPSREVAYRMPGNGMMVDLSTAGSSFDTVLYVRNQCEYIQAEIDCNDDDDSTSGLQSRLQVQTFENADTWVIVDGANKAQGTFKLRASTVNSVVPAGTCSQALSLSPGSTTTAQMVDLPAGNSSTCLEAEGETALFQFDIKETSDVVIDTFGSNFDTVIAVYSTCSDPQTEVGCNDNAEHAEQSRLSLAALPAGNYTVAISSAHKLANLDIIGTLMVRFDVFKPTTIGTCESPLVLDKPGIYTGTTRMSPDRHEGHTCSVWHGPEQVYRLDIPTGGANVVLDTQGSSFDTTLFVRKGDCFQESAEVACNEDHGTSLQARAEMALEEGTYFVFVDGYDHARGDYRLVLQMTNSGAEKGEDK